jgi:hypothetical protein
MAETGVAGTLPSLEQARSWIGHHLDDIGGNPIARVEGIFVDGLGGDPAWVVAKLGRFGRTVAVPFADCAAGAGRIWAPYSRETLREAPAIDAGRALTAEQELVICAHYGIPAGVGRAGQVEGRETGAISARPAPG